MIFEDNDLSLDVRCFRFNIHSNSISDSIRNGGLKHWPIYYFRGFNYVYYRIQFYFGKKAAERFYLDALLAFGLDLRDAEHSNKFERKRKAKSATESKEKAPLTEAPQTALQEAPEEVPASTTEQTENKDIASNVLKTNVLKAEKAEKRREDILELLRNNQYETYESLAAIFDCNIKTISRDIQQLKSSGRLLRIGDKSAGHWEVTEGISGDDSMRL